MPESMKNEESDMSVFSHLLDVDPAALIGRDPASLIMDVLDGTTHDGLGDEVRALSSLAASRAIWLPAGPKRDLTIDMAPLLCSLAPDERGVDEVVHFIHGWLVGLGDLAAVAREMDAASDRMFLVYERHGDIDLETLARISQDDCNAIVDYDDLSDRTTRVREIDGWSVILHVGARGNFLVSVQIDGRRVIIGVGSLDDDGGRTTAEPEMPILVA